MIAALLLAAGQDRHACGADVGEGGVRRGADRRHGAWRMADHCHRGPPHLPHPPGGRPASQTASAGVIFGSSLLEAPVSTTQVVASSVVGIGVGRRSITCTGRSCATWAWRG